MTAPQRHPDIAALLDRAKALGIPIRVFSAGLTGRERGWAWRERCRLYWSLWDDGWKRQRIADAAGYDIQTIRDGMKVHIRPPPERYETAVEAAKRIGEQVAAKHGITLEAIWKRKDSGRMSHAAVLVSSRQEIWRTLRTAGYGYLEIAWATMQNPNHTTVVKGVTKRMVREITAA